MSGSARLSRRTDEPRTVLCAFDGADGGTAPLTWGQRAIRRSMLFLGDGSAYFNLGHVFEVPAGRTTDDVLAAVDALIGRHEGLRTRYPGWATDAAVQTVHRSGHVRVEVVDLAGTAVEGHEGDDDPGARRSADRSVDDVASEVAARLRGGPFDHEAEWPVRFALVVEGEAPRRLVCVLSHQCMDGSAWRVLREELADLLAGREPAEPVSEWSARDIAGFEASDAGARRHAAALRRWRAGIESLPASVFDAARTEPLTPRFRGVLLESRAAAAAAQMVAAECSVSPSTVILASCLATTGHLTGHADVGVVMIVANRTRAEVRRTVAPLTQDSLLAMSLSHPTFQELVRETWVGALDAFRAAQYEPEALTAEIARVEAQRGALSDRSLFFNDVRAEAGWPQVEARPYGPAELAALQEHTVVRLDGEWDLLDLKLFYALRTDPAQVRLLLQVDTAYVDLKEARSLLVGMERLLVRAASTTVRMDELGEVTGIRPRSRPSHWVREARGWYDPEQLRDVVASFPGVDAVVVDTPAGAPPVVRVRPSAGSRLDVDEVDAHVRAAMIGRTDLLAPAAYVVEAGPGVVGGTVGASGT